MFIRRTIFSFLSLLLLCNIASAATVVISWTPSTKTVCEDGKTPIAQCPTTGYEVQEKDPATGIWLIKEGFAPSKLSVSYADIKEGTCYRVRTNNDGAFSQPSNEVCVKLPKIPPNPVSITITVTVP
jgi:hypothetical protein